MIYLVWLKGNESPEAARVTQIEVEAFRFVWDGEPTIRFYEDEGTQKLIAQFAVASVAGIHEAKS